MQNPLPFLPLQYAVIGHARKWTHTRCGWLRTHAHHDQLGQSRVKHPLLSGTLPKKACRYICAAARGGTTTVSSTHGKQATMGCSTLPQWICHAQCEAGTARVGPGHSSFSALQHSPPRPLAQTAHNARIDFWPEFLKGNADRFHCPVAPGHGLALSYERPQYFSLRFERTLMKLPDFVVLRPCCHWLWQMCGSGLQKACTCRIWTPLDQSLRHALTVLAKSPTHSKHRSRHIPNKNTAACLRSGQGQPSMRYRELGSVTQAHAKKIYKTSFVRGGARATAAPRDVEEPPKYQHCAS